MTRLWFCFVRLIRKGESQIWNAEHPAAGRRGLRYPSDSTNAEWVIVEPMIPTAKHGGRKRTINMREMAGAA